MLSETSPTEAIAETDYSDAVSTFGDRLVLAREAVEMSQQQLARHLGVKLQTLRNWEEDRSEPRSNRLQILAGVLNVSMVWLLSGKGDTPGGQVEESIGGLLSDLKSAQSEQVRIAEKLERLESRLRAVLVD